MSDVAICIEGLGKRYRLGERAPYKTIRETITRAAAAPFRALRSQAGAKTPQKNSQYIWALKDVSLEVKRGEALGIVGRNGSGKSTLLKILSRITEPTTGRAQIQGRVGSLVEVGTGFHPELTGRENVYLNGAILGMSKAEIRRRFDEIVAFAELEKFIDTPVKHYSSGMYVRLGFAVAAHMEPEILLVDEVLAVGDVAFQKKCLGRMGDVVKEERTVLFVSHNVAAIQELCPRAILLTNGHVVEDAPAQMVIASYLSTQSSLSNGDVTNPSLRRNSLANSRFRWTRVTLVNSVGKATSMLALGEPFEVIVKGFADSDLSNVLLGFAINSALGVPIFNSFQTDNGISDRLPAGEVRFRIRIDPNLLAPGLYEIGLGANGDGVVDWLPTALQFSITAVGSGDRGVWRKYRGGVIHYPCQWYME
jgi:lipopolysaccharide transport system ATP-binding protein